MTDLSPQAKQMAESPWREPSGGRNTSSVLADMSVDVITVGYIVADRLRVPSETFFIEPWRDGHTEAMGEYTGTSRERTIDYFHQMIANLRDPQGYATWMVPVVRARVV